MQRPRWLACLAMLGGLSACGAGDTFLSRATETGPARAALLFVDRGGDRKLYATSIADASPGVLELNAEGGDETVAVLYREDLPTLGLLEGPVVLPELGDRGRALPAFFAGLRSSALGESWSALEQLPDWVAETKLPLFDGAHCLSLERCIRERGDDLVCADDCSMPVLAAPDPPDPPALPELRPCPTGWQEDARADGAFSCLPQARTAPDTCAAGQAVFSDGGTCQNVGNDCPSASWPPGPGVRVRPGADTLATASATAGAGATLLLAAGRYTGALQLQPDQIVRGVCSAATTIEPPIALYVSAPLRLQDLTLKGTILAVSGAQVALDGLVVDTGNLVVGPGAHLAALNLLVSHSSSIALDAYDGGNVQLTRASFEHSFTAIRAQGPGTVVEVQDLLIRDAPDEAMWLTSGAHFRGTRVVLLHTGAGGLHISDAGTQVELDQLYAEDVGANVFRIFDDAVVDTTRLHLRQIGQAGFHIPGTGVVSARDLIVEDLPPPVVESSGTALLQSKGTLTLERVLIARTAGPGLSAFGVLEASDLTIADTGLGLDNQGPALIVGGEATVERAHVLRPRNLGVWTLRGGSLTGNDFLLEGIYSFPGPDGFVNNFNASDESPMTLNRVHVSGSGNCGGIASQRSRVEAYNVMISGCVLGVASEIEPAHVTVEDLWLEGGGYAALQAKDSGQLSARRVQLDVSGDKSEGITVEGLGTIDVQDFVLRGANTGFRFGMLGTAALENGAIIESKVGVSLLGAYDISLFPMLDGVRVSASGVAVTTPAP